MIGCVNVPSQQNVFKDPEILQSKSYQITNEVFCAVSHGIGLILAIIACISLCFKAVRLESPVHLLAYLNFTLAMCMLYFNSTLYHSLKFTRVAPLFRIFDHCAIYLLIAGSYAPYCLLVLPTKIGWPIFILEWLIAACGIFLSLRASDRFKRWETWTYIAMGWLVLFTVKPLIDHFPLPGLVWTLIGGIAYTLGTYFYVKDDQVAYYHVAWHLFVMAGSACFFIAILCYT
ncbi:hypothetical protein HMPREF2829_00290 [Aerococcus sp. HMSC072A12]|uniref:Hemolysin III family protein n=1 Tax=Aerococcus sanguinicola TaxID=119206 RepID=A0A5N1GNS7_9LACT|nr:hemolysin III family protein [Aerococcus sanguinicola]OFK19569.1 hypothetical protein HMPREF2829_00290 [Aerococcus sp. HMSC072A12]OFR32732.1 hypothetical protein HMPREF2892_06935 [Aerococcus sp. HMSC061A03]OFT40509.1 hypothetical protein HMPREF3161_05585 [Aerococcus sp. HMSC06H08]